MAAVTANCISVFFFISTLCLCNSLVEETSEPTSFFLATISDPFDSAYTDTIASIIDDFSNSTTLALGTHKALHVNYDPKYELVYWYDEQAQTINRGYSDSRYNNSYPCFSEVVMENITNGMLDIDSDNRKLYWGSSFDGMIGVADLDGGTSHVLFDSDNGAQSVSDIRVDTNEGILFWGASGSTGRLARGSIHGGNHTLLHDDVSVSTIEINPTAGIVYCITFLTPGSSPGTIQSVDYDGSNLDIDFITINVGMGAPDMVLYDGYFYITTIDFGLGIEYKVYRVQEMKGAIATAVEFVPPVMYLSGPFGNIVPESTLISLIESQIIGKEGESWTITIARTGNLFRCSSIQVTTVAETATEDDDYDGISMVLDFPAKQPTITFDLTLIDDGDIEAEETFYITLSEAVEGELGAITTLSVVIKGDNKELTTGQIIGSTLTLTPKATLNPKVFELTTGLIIGIVIVGVAVISFIAVAAAYLVYRNCCKPGKVDDDERIKDARYSSQAKSVTTYYSPQ